LGNAGRRGYRKDLGVVETTILKCVGFDYLTAVVMKSSVFWDIKPYSLMIVNRRFGGTYRLQLQRRKNIAR
jgi:hypothetical protein